MYALLFVFVCVCVCVCKIHYAVSPGVELQAGEGQSAKIPIISNTPSQMLAQLLQNKSNKDKEIQLAQQNKTWTKQA